MGEGFVERGVGGVCVEAGEQDAAGLFVEHGRGVVAGEVIQIIIVFIVLERDVHHQEVPFVCAEQRGVLGEGEVLDFAGVGVLRAVDGGRQVQLDAGDFVKIFHALAHVDRIQQQVRVVREV